MCYIWMYVVPVARRRRAATAINSTGKRLRCALHSGACAARASTLRRLAHESTVLHIGSSVFAARSCCDVWVRSRALACDFCRTAPRPYYDNNGFFIQSESTFCPYALGCFVSLLFRLAQFPFRLLLDGGTHARARVAACLPVACHWNVVPSTDWWCVCECDR